MESFLLVFSYSSFSHLGRLGGLLCVGVGLVVDLMFLDWSVSTYPLVGSRRWRNESKDDAS